MKHEPDQHDMADAQTVRSDFLAAVAAQDHKGFSEEQCFRCGWVMGRPALNCQNDDTPHRFPSHSLVRADGRKAAAERVAGIGIGLGDPYGKGWNLARTAAIAAALGEGE